MRRLLGAPFVLLAFAFASASPAAAATVTKTYRVGPIEVAPYQVKVDQLRTGISHPDENAAITAMEVDVVDADGTPVPISRLMLHHIVFLKLGAPDASCSRFTAFDDKTSFPNLAQRFFAAGEERMVMALPPGYGYPVQATDQWALTSMVMNHRAVTDTAFISYRVTYDTDPAIKPVTPVWLDVENCRADPVYDVPGGKAKGSLHERTTTWTAPQAGRFVAAGGHVHGGGAALRLSQPACGDRTLLESRPLWGPSSHPFYSVRPVLHEPGPVSMSGTLSAQGFPVAAGERVKLTSLYDAERAHTRVMGILISYFAPDPAVAAGCGSLPSDVVTAQTRPQAGRTRAPRVTVPLTGLDARGRARTIKGPPGPERKGGVRPKVEVGSYFFSKPNLALERGARVTWTFPDAILHNVTLASGPRGFSSPNLSDGRRFSVRLSARGTYRLFCALHPVDMVQRIVVR